MTAPGPYDGLEIPVEVEGAVERLVLVASVTDENGSKRVVVETAPIEARRWVRLNDERGG
jgi:hypothetical protein